MSKSDVETENKHDASLNIVLRNMEYNDRSHVVKTRHGRYQPFDIQKDKVL